MKIAKMKSFSEKENLNINIIDLDIESPVDFDLVYKAMLDESRTVIENDNLGEKELLLILLSTPTMALAGSY